MVKLSKDSIEFIASILFTTAEDAWNYSTDPEGDAYAARAYGLANYLAKKLTDD
jgi:hypothetical protein